MRAYQSALSIGDSLSSSRMSSSSSSLSCSSSDDDAACNDIATRAQRRKRAWHGEADSDSLKRTHKLSRKTSKHGAAFAKAVTSAVDASAVLSARMERAIAMWQRLDALNASAVTALVAAEPYLLFKLVDALLSTAYFPLQQLFFMTLAALLEALKHSHAASDVAALQSFVHSAQQFDASVSKLLPLHASLNWRDPTVARDRVNALNAHTRVCRAFKVAKCWMSNTDASALRRVRVDGWVDFGATTLSFYETRARETNVINVPSACVERVRRDAPNCLVYIYTRRAFRADGVALFVFETSCESFVAFSQALADTLVLEPRHDYAHLKALVPDEMLKRHGSATTSDDASQRNSHAVVSDDDESVGGEMAHDTITSDLLRFLEGDIDVRSERTQRTSSDSCATLLERFESASTSLTTAFSAMSGSCLSWSRELATRELGIKSACDALQQRSLPRQLERESTRVLAELRRDCATRRTALTHHAAESLAAIAHTANDSNQASAEVRVKAEDDASGKQSQSQQQFVVLATVSVLSAPWLLLGALLVSALLGSLHAASVF